MQKTRTHRAARTCRYVSLRCHARACGHPVCRGLSAQAQAPLEYWIVRSSRTMTTERERPFENSVGKMQRRHCVERSDEAIQTASAENILDCFADARNDDGRG